MTKSAFIFVESTPKLPLGPMGMVSEALSVSGARKNAKTALLSGPVTKMVEKVVAATSRTRQPRQNKQPTPLFVKARLIIVQRGLTPSFVVLRGLPYIKVCIQR